MPFHQRSSRQCLFLWLQTFLLGASLSHKTESYINWANTAALGGFSPQWRVTLTTPLQCFKCLFIGCVLHHHLLQLCLSNTPWSVSIYSVTKIPAGIFTPRHLTRSSIYLNTHTHIHTSSQLKPSCHASVMGRSAAATAMKDNIIKLDISGGKANSLSTVIRVMHWHSPPRGHFNCVQTRAHTLTCKQTHTPPRTSVCAMLQLGGLQNKPVYCVRLFFSFNTIEHSVTHTQYMLSEINSVVTLYGWTFPWCIWKAGWMEPMDFIPNDRRE